MSDIHVTVNGERQLISDGITLEELVDSHSPTRKGIAVAIDRSIVPKSLWHETLVEAGMVIEIVSAAAGG
jgi:sulfur carrier protein